MGKIIRIPLIGKSFGFGFASDRHGAATRARLVTGDNAYETKLMVKVLDKDGNEKKVTEYFGNKENLIKRNFYKLLYRNKTELDLGSGLVTNVGVLAMANDWNLAGPSGAPINTLKLANYHASGKGATAAAATDINLQTISTNGGQTPVAGTQSTISAANSQKYQTVATIAYTGTEAVTEWGLFCGGTLSSTTGSPFTAASATTWSDTGSAQTASSSTVQGLQQKIVVPGTTTVWGLNTSNTTHIGTIPAWYKVADGTAGSTPGNTETFTIVPVMWDHKVFSAINVVNGDSIQFTYQLTVTSGG
jgi:hypothetical protein